jgi:hypothetical protein
MKVGGRIGFTEHTIEDLITRVRQRFIDDTELRKITILDGWQDNQAEGSSQRIVFIPADGEITLGGIRCDGSFGTYTDVVEAHIWGLEDGKDYGQDSHLAAKGIASEIAAAVSLDWGQFLTGDAITVSKETHVLKYGEHLVMTIRLQCPMYHVNKKTAPAFGGAKVGV